MKKNPPLIRDLVYGVSGSGKTTWWLALASALFESTGKKTRWYIGDGGGTTISVSGVDDFVEVMQFNLWPNPLETTQRIAEGWWPVDPQDPASKLLPSNPADLVPYGLFVYEGLSVTADYIMGDKPGGLAWRMAKGETINNDASFKIKDGELSFGGNARTHYGFTQRRILDLIERTRALPVHVGWTAHERKVEDEDYRETWIGPDVSGKALTTKVGASFGNTIHLHSVKTNAKQKDPVTGKSIDSVSIERRAYTRTHYDPEGSHFVRYYANTRMPVGATEQLPEWVDPDPVGYYRMLQEARERASKSRPGLGGVEL